jgi:Secretion system C-terminal sorting domain
MKKIYTLFLALILTGNIVRAQVVKAMDFNMNDCNGKMHHLFGELDSQNVVILEFFMLSCSPCIVAGHELEGMLPHLRKSYGVNKVKFYHFGFTNSYTCSQITSWVSTNNFTSLPFDSGGMQVAYYGGMGMPTIAVVAGSNHQVLWLTDQNTPFTANDTTVISNNISHFLDSISTLNSIQNKPAIVFNISTYPNPASDRISISINSEKAGDLRLSLMSIEGKKVIDISSENIKAGSWSKTVSLHELAGGLYFLRGEMNQESFTRKIIVRQSK